MGKYIRIEELKEKDRDFRTFMNRHSRRYVEEILNYYEDNDNVSKKDLLSEFESLKEMEVEILLEVI